ncbi:VWA domain-containing protein [Verrucomicrobium sp. BvORR106]|uniref:vWA domain-containing protein n=1 Tax=Verrucomicrobium sp. BvORR106 TaxID=1403819 RepID=UPI0005700F43|nr:VWA domain-containing protein [Verrucomicrobium sp. BvORR106]
MIEDFHFLRPLWLLTLIPAVLIWWLVRRHTDPAQPWRGIIAPHLLPHLLSGKEHRAKFTPLDLIAIGWLIGAFVIAGPSWRREPTPFANDTAALAIVVQVSPSMETEDVLPSRLARATEKIQDLLRLRPGAKTSLIAYAGSAHVVMPLTTDSGIINTFAGALHPKIMPKEGDAAAEALQLAERTLADAATGSILWLADTIAPDQAKPLAQWREQSDYEVRILPPLLPGTELETLKTSAQPVRATFTPLAADDADVQSLARLAKFSDVGSHESSNRWRDGGYYLVPLLALLMLPFFRRGWMVPTAAR